MRQIDWKAVTAQTRELFPQVVQIVSYSRNRWMLVFEDEPDNFISTFHPLSVIIRKYKLFTPLIVSRRFILTSLDSYPLEFLDIQSDYTNLYAAEDIIADLQFEKTDVRLQIERELKSKWLLTRVTALNFNRKALALFTLLKESFTSLLPVFKGFCHLNGVNIPKDTVLLIDQLEEVLHTDIKVLKYISSQEKAPSLILLNNLFNDYIRLLNTCSEKIDSWKLA
jgi:hypothetical protein